MASFWKRITTPPAALRGLVANVKSLPGVGAVLGFAARAVPGLGGILTKVMDKGKQFADKFPGQLQQLAGGILGAKNGRLTVEQLESLKRSGGLERNPMPILLLVGAGIAAYMLFGKGGGSL
jgi:hypothetical protein